MSFCAIDFLDPGSLACRSLGQRFMKQYKTSLFLHPSLFHIEATPSFAVFWLLGGKYLILVLKGTLMQFAWTSESNGIESSKAFRKRFCFSYRTQETVPMCSKEQFQCAQQISGPPRNVRRASRPATGPTSINLVAIEE